MTRELLLGCGHSRIKKVFSMYNDISNNWHNLLTVDSNPECKPEYVFDLNLNRWNDKLPADYFDEVHAYEVLEHLGHQGDINSFFSTFYNIWRILVSGGFLCATTPSRYSKWLWGDPGHTRSIQPEHLVFLDQENYKQCGVTTMSDYRNIWKGNFKTISSTDDRETHTFILQAIK